MRTNRKRVALPFLFRAADCRGAGGALIVRSYGNEVTGVFTRAGIGAVRDSNAALFPVGYGLPALGVERTYPSLLLQASADNCVLQSENFGTIWGTVPAPTRTAAAHTSTGVSLDLLNDDAAGTAEAYTQVVTFTGTGSKTLSVYLKAGTATTTSIHLFDDTAGIPRGAVDVTWSGGVPSLAVMLGTSVTLNAVQLIADGVYRVSFVIAGVVAANTNTLYVYIAGTTVANTGTVYAGGVMAQNSAELSGYIKTTTVAVTRAADSCYFPFTLTPRAMTLYVRGVERMNPTVAASANSGIVTIADASLNDPSLSLLRASGAMGYRFQHDPATGTTASITSPTTIRGDLVELRGVLGSDGAPTLGQSINGGTESTNGPGTAQTIGTAWSASRLYLNSLGSGSLGQFAFTHVAIALGTKTVAEMRELAEVY